VYVSPEIVVGFHGCDQKIYDNVVKNGKPLKNSENKYDWLGHGIYFWEGSYGRALDWAKCNPKKILKPTVVGAFIKLGNCLDLLDITHLENVKASYKLLKNEFDILGLELPENNIIKNGISFSRELDCLVIQRLQQMNNEEIAARLGLRDTVSPENKRKIQHDPQFFDTVRGMFPEGEDLYKGAGFRAKNHIQLCVINPNSIIGYFGKRNSNSWFKKV